MFLEIGKEIGVNWTSLTARPASSTSKRLLVGVIVRHAYASGTSQRPERVRDHKSHKHEYSGVVARGNGRYLPVNKASSIRIRD